MADLGNRTNVNTAINLLLDDAQPNEAIQPSDHNTLLQNILDTLANGLSVTLRTNPETGGQDIQITSGDKLKYKSSTFFNSLVSATLTADRTLTFPDKTDTIATLTDIENIMNTNGLILGGNFTHDLNSNNLVFDDGSFRLTNGSLGVLGSFNATHDGATGQDVATFISSSANPIMVLSNTYEAVAIGTTGPATSAILDIESTSKGVLFPRMTTTQRNAISTPAESMFIYNTTTEQFEFRASGGTWDALGGGGDSIYTANGSLTSDRTIDIDGNDLEILDTSVITTASMILKTNQGFLFNRNTSGAAVVYSSNNVNHSEFGQATTYLNADVINLGSSTGNNGLKIEGDRIRYYTTVGTAGVIHDIHADLFRLFVSGFSTPSNSHFLVGALTRIGTEDISLQGNTLISKKLELSSTTNGILLNRLTNLEMASLIATAQDNEIIFNKDKHALYRFDTTLNNWVALAAGFGLVSISDASGNPTFFANYTAAMSAATAGQTVNQYGNITETGNVTITITDGVNVNMNGFTYTLDGSNNTAFIYSASSTTTKFINGTVIKQNSPTQGTGGGYGLEVLLSPDLDCSGLTIISDGEQVLNFNTSGSGQGLITNGNFIFNGTSTGFICTIEGRLINSFIDTNNGVIRLTGDGLYNSTIKGAVTTTSLGQIKNCIINNTNSAVGLDINGAQAFNCTVNSQNSDGIFVDNVDSQINNCSGSSNTGFGINLQKGKAFNSIGKSQSLWGLQVRLNTAFAYFCTGESETKGGIYLHSGNLSNCIGKSNYNNIDGHGIEVFNNNGLVINCSAVVVNTGANAIDSGNLTTRSVSIAGLTGEGMNTLIGTRITNTQTNTIDTFGNILI